MKWIKENWFKLGILTLIIIFGVGFLYTENLKMKDTEDENEIQLLNTEDKVNTSTSDILGEQNENQQQEQTDKIEENSVPKANETAPLPSAQTNPTPQPEPPTNVQKSETETGFDFDTFTEDDEELQAFTIGILSGSPALMCPAIIDSWASKNNAYWHYKDKYEAFVAKYSPYAISLSFVQERIEGNYTTIQIVKNRCWEWGYNIP